MGAYKAQVAALRSPASWALSRHVTVLVQPFSFGGGTCFERRTRALLTPSFSPTQARDNKLTLEDMAGGTFTISNGGVFGSLFGTPILNLPGSAILGMHAINRKPWVVGDKIEIRPIMVVALTYDHRLLDGREAVQTLVKIKQYIEDPASMLLAEA